MPDVKRERDKLTHHASGCTHAFYAVRCFFGCYILYYAHHRLLQALWRKHGGNKMRILLRYGCLRLQVCVAAHSRLLEVLIMLVR